jgi:hypothetical protein
LIAEQNEQVIREAERRGGEERERTPRICSGWLCPV